MQRQWCEKQSGGIAANRKNRESLLEDSRKYTSSLLFYTKRLNFAILFCKISQKYFEFLRNVTKMSGFFFFFYDFEKKSRIFQIFFVNIQKNIPFCI